MSAAEPLVSLGVPVYNGEACLRRALDSLVGQTYRNLEIIVCDNGSTDSTPALCAEYAARDSRVRYVRNETNIGIIGNFRRVFELSTGKYFTWAAADDLRPTDAIRIAVAALERNPQSVMVHGPVRLRMGKESVAAEIPNDMSLATSDTSARIRAFTRGLDHNAMLYGVYRREALARATLGKHYGQDYLVCLKLCQVGPIEYVASPLVVYRQRPERVEPPMYRIGDLSLTNLLFYRGVMRNKCWTVLGWGCYYLAADRQIRAAERLGAITTYVGEFTRRFRRELSRECLFIACTPLMWLLRPGVPMVSRLKSAWHPSSRAAL
jgi:glycosyltransferase involved in cell wall biosynthesis